MSNIQNGNKLYDIHEERLTRHGKAIGETKEDIAAIKTRQEVLIEDVKDVGKAVVKVEDCVHKESKSNLRWMIGLLGTVLTILLAVEFRGWILGG